MNLGYSEITLFNLCVGVVIVLFSCVIEVLIRDKNLPRILKWYPSSMVRQEEFIDI